MSVAVVVTGDDVADAKAGNEDFGHEIVGRGGREGVREARAEEVVRAAFAQPPRLGAKRREAPRRPVGPQDVRRVGFEREHAERKHHVRAPVPPRGR